MKARGRKSSLLYRTGGSDVVVEVNCGTENYEVNCRPPIFPASGVLTNQSQRSVNRAARFQVGNGAVAWALSWLSENQDGVCLQRAMTYVRALSETRVSHYKVKKQYEKEGDLRGVSRTGRFPNLYESFNASPDIGVTALNFPSQRNQSVAPQLGKYP